VKIQRPAPDRFVLQLSLREQKLLFETIKLYPLVHASHHRLTRAANAQSEENQRLLEASLAEQRTENRRQIEALLTDPGRLQKQGRSFHLELKPGDCEWLLQVLNDIRVGSWIALGEPDEDKPPEITGENYRFAVAQEVCGAFQSLLLAALGETESPEWLG
jgi:hypothetical protein